MTTCRSGSVGGWGIQRGCEFRYGGPLSCFVPVCGPIVANNGWADYLSSKYMPTPPPPHPQTPQHCHLARRTLTGARGVEGERRYAPERAWLSQSGEVARITACTKTAYTTAREKEPTARRAALFNFEPIREHTAERREQRQAQEQQRRRRGGEESTGFSMFPSFS